MSAQPNPFGPSDVLRILLVYRMRWVVPAVMITLMALGVAIVRRPNWEASQALVLREEGVGRDSRLGRFDSVEAMKTAQETIMELSKSQGVLRNVLMALNGEEPSSSDIDSLRAAIKVSAPKGIEFGKSEVFYLTVKAKSKEQAIELTSGLAMQLDHRLRELRERKAESLVNELSEAVELAERQLNEATQKLADVESELGSDLAELRILNEVATGESNLRQTLIQIKNELRQASVDKQTYDELLRLLEAARTDPQQLVATPNHLLQAQPALQRLKDGLVDSQLKTAQLLGELSPDHPRVLAAMTAQKQIATRLHSELADAISGIEAQRYIIGKRVALLESQLADLTQRMERIAQVRPRYANLVADVSSRADILKTQQNDLAQAIASRQAARMSGQLTPLDEPTTGDGPSGPGRSVIVAGGMVVGLAAGLGLLFLTVPVPTPGAEGIPVSPDRSRQELLWKTGEPMRSEETMVARTMETNQKTPTNTIGGREFMLADENDEDEMTYAERLAAGQRRGAGSSNYMSTLKNALKDFLCIKPSWN
ncbi:MAG: hypothetical protein KDA59_12725 [Planctomycetales bacterium]|nr:hypothetical protein [Planctomycetales bacterium]